MKDTYDLDSSFSVKGLFYIPAEGYEEITGELVFSPNEITVERAAYAISAAEAFGSGAPSYDVMYGVTAGGDCTVFDLFEQPGDRSFLADGRVLAAGKYLANRCVIGMHVSSESAPLITSASFQYAGLSEWLGTGVTTSFDIGNDQIHAAHSIFSPVLAEHRIDGLSSNLTLSFGRRSLLKGGVLSFTSNPLLTITPDESQSLSWFVDVSARIENFLSLMLGTSTGLLNMRLCMGEKRGYFLRRRLAIPEQAEHDLWIRFSDAGEVLFWINSWFSLPRNIRPIENLIFGTIRNSSMFVETKFLSLAQAFESLHRVTDKTLLMDDEPFAEVKRMLSGIIDFFFPASPIAVRLKESISHANEVTFSTRVNSLLSRVTRTHHVALVGNPDLFVTQLRDTRNFFTHPGTRQKTTVVTAVNELYKFNQRLQALLRLLIFLQVGIPEARAYEAVKGQMDRYVH